MEDRLRFVILHLLKGDHQELIGLNVILQVAVDLMEVVVLRKAANCELHL